MKVITPNFILPNRTAYYNNTKKSFNDVSNDTYLTNSLNNLSFLGKTSLIKQITKPEFFKKHAELLKDWKYSNNIKEFVSGLKDGSKELEDIDTLLECFDNAKYSSGMDTSYRLTPNEIIFESFKGVNGINGVNGVNGVKLPRALSDDLAILKKGENVIDNYIPILTKNEAENNTKIGDLFQIGKKDRVCIKNRSGEIEELKMTRHDCIKLFPPVFRVCNIQPKGFGNCYEETALNAIISNPETRENLFRCIDTVSDPNKVTVKFPKGILKEGITFNSGAFPINEGDEFYSQGCKGIQFIQYALGKEYETEFVEFELKKLQRQGKDSAVKTVANMYSNGKSVELANYFNGRFYQKSLGTNLRHGGTAIVPWYKMGLTEVGESNLLKEKYTMAQTKDKVSKYKHETDNREYTHHYFGDLCTEDLDSYCERIESPEFFKTHLVQAVIHDENNETKLMPNHSYKLDAEINDDGKIKNYLLKNPHDLTETVLTFDDVIEQIDHIFFAKISK